MSIQICICCCPRQLRMCPFHIQAACTLRSCSVQSVVKPHPVTAGKQCLVLQWFQVSGTVFTVVPAQLALIHVHPSLLFHQTG